jgi:anthranilate 1,2-dioxygenase small subunit
MIENVYQMIARAQAEYARCIDDDRLEEWPDHFHGQCTTGSRRRPTTAKALRQG